MSKIRHVHRFKNVRTGESFVAELEIDIDEVSRRLAARALGSKVGKSKAMYGDIKCKIISRGDDAEKKNVSLA